MKGSVTLMTQRQKALLSCAVAAALLLSGCRKGNSDSGSMSSSNAMSGSSGSASTTQTGGWKTGLGILTEASDEARTGTIHTIAAAVLLDGDGKLAIDLCNDYRLVLPEPNEKNWATISFLASSYRVGFGRWKDENGNPRLFVIMVGDIPGRS